MCWGAFHGTGLDEHLKNLNVTQVFVCGIATSIGVESTARYAHEHGYHVALVTDAMTDLDPVSHQHSIEKIFPRLGETTTTNEVLSSLSAIS
jgi:nicotinamidase-related amidase